MRTAHTADSVERLDGSIVQHGPHNDRIYVMHLHGAASQSLIPKLDRLAQENGYGKIFAKIPATHWQAFQLADYTIEAVVPGFYRGETDGLFIAKYLSRERRQVEGPAVSDPLPRPAQHHPSGLTAPLPITTALPDDAAALAKIYGQVFESYPFPIHQPEYLKAMMASKVSYFCIRIDNTIVAVAAAEVDSANLNCEMTDFATLPELRGKGLAGMLLDRMDDETRSQGIKTAYTIARADSPGINAVFKRRGYRYGGRLNKNSQIGGEIRSMNVWYRRL